MHCNGARPGNRPGAGSRGLFARSGGIRDNGYSAAEQRCEGSTEEQAVALSFEPSVRLHFKDIQYILSSGAETGPCST